MTARAADVLQIARSRFSGDWEVDYLQARLMESLSAISDNRGKKALAAAHARSAIEICEKCLKDRPRSTKVRRLIADCKWLLAIILERDEGEPILSEAIKLHSTLVADFPDVPAYMIGLAQDYRSQSFWHLNSEDFDQATKASLKAADLFSKAWEMKPRDVYTGVFLAHSFQLVEHVHKKRGQLEEARAIAAKVDEIVERVLENHSLKQDQPDYFAGRGRLLHRFGKYSEAVVEFDHAIARGLISANVYFGRADALICLNRLEEAAGDMESAIKLQPDKALYHFGVARITRSLKKFDESLTAINHAINLDAECARFYFKRFAIYEGLERYAEAINDLEITLRL